MKELRENSFKVAGTASFSNGDGLCFLDDNRELQGFRVNRVEGNRLFPLKMPEDLRPGLRLYRNSDQAFDRLMAATSSERKIPVTMSLRPTSDGFALSMDDVEVEMKMEHQQAEKPQRDNIVRQLTRLGGTPYVCVDLVLPDQFNFFIPSSQLADLRRQVVAKKSAMSTSHITPITPTSPVTPIPPYHPPYLYNIANSIARSFYERLGMQQPTDAFELKEPKEGLLMQCRHCLRYALGYCVKHGGHKPEWREPLFLRLGNGQHFRLEFDCRNCQMNVYAT